MFLLRIPDTRMIPGVLIMFSMDQALVHIYRRALANRVGIYPSLLTLCPGSFFCWFWTPRTGVLLTNRKTWIKMLHYRLACKEYKSLPVFNICFYLLNEKTHTKGV